MTPKRPALIFFIAASLLAALAMLASATHFAAPSVEVFLPSGQPYKKGHTLAVTIVHRDVPPDSGLVLRVLHDLPESQRHGYDLRARPIVLRPIPISGSGTHRYEWVGQRTGWAPADAPTWNKSIEFGRYRIEATLFDRARFGILGWPDRRPRKQIAKGVSQPFRVVGKPDLSRLSFALLSRAIHHLIARTGIRSPRYGIDQYVRMVKPVSASKDGYCAVFDAVPPYLGRITACAPLSIMGPNGLRTRQYSHLYFSKATGEVSYDKRVVPYDIAVMRGHTLVASVYDFLGGQGRENRVEYLADKRAWRIVIGKREPSKPRGQRVADILVVHVHDDRTACIARVESRGLPSKPTPERTKAMCR